MQWEGLTVPTLEGFTGFVPPDGTGSNRVLIMAEAPGEQEIKVGRPLYEQAPAGATFARLLRRAGLERDSFVISNSVWSRPPNNYLDGSRYEGQAIAAYEPFRNRLCELYRPRVIVALGGVALRTLTNYGGRGASITAVQGYVLDSRDWAGVFVIPALHPSAIMRGEQRMSGVVIWALQRAVDIARNGFVRAATRYITNPSLADALEFERGYSPEQHFLSYDIETAESGALDEEEVDDKEDDISYAVSRISLCYSAQDGHAISFPWQPPFVDIAKRMLASPGPKRVWNCPTPDQRILRADLRWTVAGALQVGDKLVGFDAAVANGRKIRRYREATVTHAERGTAIVYAVKLSDGTTVKVTGEHPWLRCNRQGKGPHAERNCHWEMTKNFGVGSPIRRLFTMWEENRSYESGVLSGFFDGEGHIIATNDGEQPKSMSVGATQNEGNTLNRICNFIRQLGFTNNEYRNKREREEKVRHIRIAGGASETARFLGTVRPFRLLEKFKPSLLGAVWPRQTPWLTIESIQCLGVQQIIRLSTDISTYVLEGFGAHNSNFDNPRLKAAGAPINGRNYDAMWAWKFLQPTLPRSLGFVAPFYNWTGEPWKNTSDVEPEAYSCKDAHALQQIADGVDAHLRQKGQWDVYERHVVQLGEVLTKMSANGLPYSAERAKAFETELQGKWDERFRLLQERVPDELKPPKQKQGLKRAPKELTGYVQRVFKVLGSDITTDEHDQFALAGPVAEHDIVEVKRWCKLEPFLPTSTQQVQALLKSHGLPVGKNRKTKRDSADDEHLKKMCKRIASVKKHSELLITLQMIRECRQLSKVLGTYVKGWKPGRDGRIHATPGYWGKMFRVSWRRPNISATIQDKQEEYVAQGFRRCVAVGAGRMLLECDWKGIEAVLVGWFAGDSEYMRLARLGVHDYMGLHMAGRSVDLSQSDDDLRHLFRDFKHEQPKLRDDAKHTVHGTNYGMGPFLMAEQYEMTVANAKRLQGLYFDLFPRVKAWQKSVLDRASRECKLRNPFGYEMPFWEVYRWDSKRQDYILGEDAKSAIAFLPRDTAAAMLKEVLLRLKPLADAGVMLCSTHDSITCEVPERDLMGIASVVKTEMEACVPELDGLSIGVEVKAGSAWHEDSMDILDIATAVTA